MNAADWIVTIFGWLILAVALAHIWGRACRGRDHINRQQRGNP